MANNQDNKEEAAWAFPDMGSQERFVESGEEASYVFDEIGAPAQPQVHAEIEKQEQVESNTHLTIEEEPVIDNLQKEKEQLELLIQEHEKKINLLNNILFKLKNPISVIDEEVMDLIQDLIKKITKKIINQEIEKNIDLLPNIINELKNMMPAQGATIKIAISEKDYQRLGKNIKKIDLPITASPALNEGDVIVKSEFNEIRAILSERIEQLLRIKHE